MSILQSLDRGLEALELISIRPWGASAQELADQLDVHRAVVYRILATLERRNLAVKGSDNRYRLGSGGLAITERYLSQYRTAAQPMLVELADATSMTAFLAIAEHNQAVAVAVAEPHGVPFGVSYRVGARHDLHRGADGVAILARRPAQPGEPASVQIARERGIALSYGELQPGAFGIAIGVATPASGGLEASIGLITLGDGRDRDIDQLLPHLKQAKLRISDEL